MFRSWIGQLCLEKLRWHWWSWSAGRWYWGIRSARKKNFIFFHSGIVTGWFYRRCTGLGNRELLGDRNERRLHFSISNSRKEERLRREKLQGDLHVTCLMATPLDITRSAEAPRALAVAEHSHSYLGWGDAPHTPTPGIPGSLCTEQREIPEARGCQLSVPQAAAGQPFYLHAFTPLLSQ